MTANKTASKKKIESIYPLSPLQQGMLFHTLYAPDSGAYIEQVSCELHGSLDVTAFRQAWEQVIARHAILRTSFHWTEQAQPRQVVHQQVKIPWTQRDWRELGPAEQQPQLEAFLQADRDRDFELTRAPLLRLSLLRLADDTYQFVWSNHHAILDGWSRSLVFKEVLDHYAVQRRGQPFLLSAPRPYRDYIAWLERQDLARAEVFWRQYLADFTAPTSLRVDRPAMPHAPVGSATESLELPEAATAALQQFARKHQFTLSTLVQAAWALLLNRYNGEPDVVFGMTVAGRPPALPDVETMVGLFINTLPVRVRVAPELPVRAWLQQLQAQSAELRQYEYTPLVQVQGWSALPQGQPLFESIVVFENYPVDTATRSGPGGIELRRIRAAEQTNYPLTLVVVPDRALRLRLVYVRARFIAAAVARLLEHLRTLLEGIAADPEQRLRLVSLLTATERQQLLVEWNPTAVSFPQDRLVHQLVEAQAQSSPDAIALVCDRGQGSGVRGQGLGRQGDKETRRQGDKETEDRRSKIEDRRSRIVDPPSSILHPQSLTYHELNARANQLAHYLQSLGVGPEAPVAICVERSAELVIGLLGILKAGGAYVPLDPSYPPERLAFMLADSQARALIAGPSLREHIPAQPLHTLYLDDLWTSAALAAVPSTAPLGGVCGANLAYIIYTSGSTGRPKGTQITHQSLLNLIFWHLSAFGITRMDRATQVAGPAFDACGWELWPYLAQGASVHLPGEETRTSPLHLQQWLIAAASTISFLPTPLAEGVLSLEWPAETRLRALLTGGDRLSRYPTASLPFEVVNNYGPTENTVVTTSGSVPPDRSAESAPAIGRPISNTQLYVLDAQMQPVPIGVPGELYVGGAGLARGYLGRPDLTAAAFIPNPFANQEPRTKNQEPGMDDEPVIQNSKRPEGTRTQNLRLYRSGDLVRYRPDGNIEFLGRRDEQVKLRGYRIELGEIAMVLAQHPAVREALVVAREDIPGEKRLVAYVVPKIEDRRLKIEDSGSDALDPLSSILYLLSSELRRFLQTKLPAYMIPSAFVELDALPLTPNGKVDRRALPAPDPARPAAEAIRTSQTPIQEVMVGIWQQVLGLEQVGIHDNFFALGGHSLLATQLIARVRSVLGVELPLRALFEAPTPAQLAAQLASAREVAAPPIMPAARTAPLPLSFAQQRLWFLDRFMAAGPAYHIPAGLRIQGALDIAALERAFSALIARHEALRTTFADDLGRPVQVITPPAPWTLPLLDLRAQPESERETHAQHLIAAEARYPFDLRRGPLMRVTLLRLHDADHRLVLVIHHIVFDGWSMGVLLRELSLAYAAYAAGRAPNWPALPVQYADYAAWQREWLQGPGVRDQGSGRQGDKETRRQGDKETDVDERSTQNSKLKTQNSPLEVQLAYWRQRLAGAPALLALPTDRPRPAVQSLRGACSSAIFPAELAQALKRLSQRAGATLFMTLLAAFKTLLSHYTRQTDILVGIPIAGRTHCEIEDLIGFFVNALVLRSDLSGGISFRELLARVRAATLDAHTYQNLPFEKLVEELAPERNLSYTPLFQVAFDLQMPGERLSLPGLDAGILEIDTGTVKQDLALVMTDTSDGLEAKVRYSADLFDETTITRILGHLQTLLEGIAANPDERLERLPLLSGAERRWLLVARNSTDVPYAEMCLHQIVEAQAAQALDSVALVFDRPPTTDHRPPTTARSQGSGVRGQEAAASLPPPAGGGTEGGEETSRQADKQIEDRRSKIEDRGSTIFHPPSSILYPQSLTYRELNTRANQLAHYLRSLGVGPETLVALCVERSVELIVGMLGVLKAGGAYLPLDPAQPPARLAFMLEDSQAQVLLTTNDQRPTTNDLRPATTELRRRPTNDDRPTYGYDISYPQRPATTDLRSATCDDRPATCDVGPQSPIAVDLDADWDAIAREDGGNLPALAELDQLAYVIYTSGSTGIPKGTLVTHRGLGNVILSQQQLFQLTPASRVLQFAAQTFDASIFEIMMALGTGARLCLPHRAAGLPGPELIGLLEQQAITIMTLTPSTLTALPDAALPALHTITVAGEACPAELVARWAPGRQFFNLYGPTETTIWATAAACAPGDARPPIGYPITNTQVYVLDRNLEPAPVGVPGEIYIGGVGLARGYLNRPDLTAERFVPNPFVQVLGDGCWVLEDSAPNTQHPTPNTRLYKTCDLARYRADGQIEYLGRIDDQVKIRGFRIELGEIEAALESHPLVREAAVLAREDAPGEKRLVAYVVEGSGVRGQGSDARSQESGVRSQEPTGIQTPDSLLHSAFCILHSDELRAFLQAKLPEYMVPSMFVTLEALPLTPSGKLDRRALPAPDTARSALASAYAAPQTAAEQVLAGIWQQVLRLEQVGIHESFFTLGGDSILSIQVVARAAQAGLVFTPRDLFQHQTIARLAAVVQVSTSAATPLEPEQIAGPLPLTPIQRWFFAQELPKPQHYNQALLLQPRAPLDRAALQAALQQLLQHHHALRLRFVRTTSGWTAEQVEPVVGRPLHLAVVDLAGVAAERQAAALEEVAARAQAGLDLASGNLLRTVYFELGAAGARLLLIIHHLAVDGVSWRIVLDDLQTAYRQLTRGQEVRLPPRTTAFASWAQQLQTYAQRAELAAQAPYWQAMGADIGIALDGIPDGGLAALRAANTHAAEASVRLALDVAATRALLQEVPRAYRTHMQEVLLAALGLALAEWSEVWTVRVDLEGHGREELVPGVELTRTVGWFTTLYPLRLELGEVRAELGTVLKAVKEQVRAVPQRGIGYGLLRYLRTVDDAGAALRVQPPAPVLFNYLGQVDQAFSGESLWQPAPEAAGPRQSPCNPRPYLLDVNALVVEDQLQVQWTYSTNLHRRTTVEALAEQFLQHLQALIAHCQSPSAGGYTPSDFPLAALDQAALDRLLAGSRQIEDIYPLSPMQQGMLFHTLYAPDSGVYVEQMVCRLCGSFDVAGFKIAWEQVVARHAILRTSFHWDDQTQPLQVVHQQVALPWTEEDWRGLNAAAQQARLTDLLLADRARGFELTWPPLIRLMILQLADDTYQFVWTHHHLLLDGWSLPLVMQELFSLYDVQRLRMSPALVLARPYRDYIAWLQQQNLAQAEVFWRRTLAGFTSPTDLRVQCASAGDVAAEGAPGYVTEVLELSEATTAALQQFARQHQLTLSTLVQAAWALLLGRYSGTPDVVFGTTVSGRPADLPGVETMVGLFINTLPVRVRIAPDQPALAWLQQLQAQLVELRQYEYTPLAQVQSWSDAPRGQPLFESIVVFENHPVDTTAAVGFSGVTFQQVQASEQTNYPLTLGVGPGPILRMVLLYACDRFTADVIARLLGHLRTLLEGMLTDARRPVSALPLLTEPERRQLLVEWNAMDQGVRGQGSGVRSEQSERLSSDHWCIHHLFAVQAARSPDAVALVFDRPPTTTETRRQGDKETRRQGDKETGSQGSEFLAPNPQSPTPLPPPAGGGTEGGSAWAWAALSPQSSVLSPGQLTYSELNERANRLAHHLRPLGVGPEVRVGICMERSLELVVGLLGILKAGGAYVPLDPTYPAERLAFMLEDAQVSVLLTQKTIYDLRFTIYDLPADNDQVRELKTQNSKLKTQPVTPSPPHLVTLSESWPAIALCTADDPVGALDPANLAYVIYTSGSTGTPKGVMITHRSLVNAAWAWQEVYQLTPADRHLQMASVAFDVFAGDLARTLGSGATLVLCPRALLLDPPGLAALLTTQQITCAEFVPVVVRHLAEHLRHVGGRLEGMRLLICGSDTWSMREYQQVRELCGSHTRLINSFGLTEATIDSTYFEGAPQRAAGGALVPIGRPFATTRLYLLDAQMQPVPIGVPGELYIAGAGLARGYLDQPARTAAAFVPNPFAGVTGDRCWVSEDPAPNTQHPTPNTRLYKTGDLARYRPDGQVEFLGRADQQIKLRGYRIELGEIEAALAQHPDVRDAVALVREDAPGEKRLVAYVVPKIEDRGLKIEDSGSDAPDPLSSILYPLSSELRAFLQARLPEYMVPSAFVTLDALPLTPNGKLDRRALPAPDLSQAASESSVPPQTSTQALLAEAWRQVLGLEQVGIHDNFFALGGDSILSIQIVARAARAGLRLTPRDLFQHQTVAELAAVVAPATTQEAAVAEQGLVSGPAPLTPIQRWFFEEDIPAPQHYNQALLLQPRVPLDVACLEQALRHLLQHHDALRLRFVRDGMSWHQDNAGLEGLAGPLLEVVDLAALPLERQAALLEAHAAQAQAGLDLAAGTLLRAVYFDLGAGGARLLLIIHHLAVDGVSWRILLDDLQAAYQQLSQGQAVMLPPKTTAFASWARQLQTYAQRADLRQQAAYWLTTVTAGADTSIALDIIPEAGLADLAAANTQAASASVRVALDAAATRALLQTVPQAYQTQIAEVLLAALGLTLAGWTGERRVLVDLEGHGREELLAGVDLTRTVGWFTSVFPVLLDLGIDDDLGAVLKRAKEQLRGVPQRGIGYGLLRYLCAEDAAIAQLRELPSAAISFNYLGQFDQSFSAAALWEPAPESIGPAQSAAARRSYLLEINALISGEQLQVHWTYSTNLHRHATIAALAGQFLEQVRALIAHCQSPQVGSYTPSDFPDVDLTQQDLDDLFTQLDDVLVADHSGFEGGDLEGAARSKPPYSPKSVW